MLCNRHWSDELAGVLLGKVLDGRLASFVRAEGEVFIVSVDGQEKTVSRDFWRGLPEQRVEEGDRVHHLGHHRRHSG
jgi:hypothetical protein